MNQTMTSFCLDAFDKSLSSPIGCAIKFFYESLPFIPKDNINILLLRDRLIDRNYYNSVESFIMDLQSIINHACRFFGTDSDMSIALLSFQYSIKKSLQPVLEISQSSSTESTNDTETQEKSEISSKWEKSKNKLLENLNNVLNEIPNDIESYNILTDPIPSPPYIDTEEHEKYPNPDINIDLIDLKSRIERIDQDINVYELMDIIENHQPELSGTVGLVRVDLKLCHPHTIYLINEFVKKCKLRPPPNSDRIQRSQSLPVKKSNSSSTIILQNPLHNKSFQQQQELQQQVQNQQQMQNQLQAQHQNHIQPNSPNLFSNNGSFFNSNGMSLQASLQSINQQQLQLQLKNINSYNIKNNRNNVSFSHTSSNPPAPISLNSQDQSQPSASSLIGFTHPQSCLVSTNQDTTSQMMSNITVQPSTMSTISQKSKQKRQYKTQNKKNQYSADIAAATQNSIQMQLQMQMQQQNQQNLNSDTHQFSPFLKEAISIARMNNLMNFQDMGLNTTQNELQQQQPVQQATTNSVQFSAPPTPGSQIDSTFNTAPKSGSMNLESAFTTSTATAVPSNTFSSSTIAPPPLQMQQLHQLQPIQAVTTPKPPENNSYLAQHLQHQGLVKTESIQTYSSNPSNQEESVNKDFDSEITKSTPSQNYSQQEQVEKIEPNKPINLNLVEKLQQNDPEQNRVAYSNPIEQQQVIENKETTHTEEQIQIQLNETIDDQTTK